ncbi:hypothetical protein [Modestobacter marinus]|nr:hypothetical protein [Modestobacter marinus]
METADPAHLAAHSAALRRLAAVGLAGYGVLVPRLPTFALVGDTPADVPG